MLFVQQGLISPDVAVWLIAGANVGTSSTALLASTVLDVTSRKLAVLNVSFNLLGVFLFATLLQPIVGLILDFDIAADQQIALVHTVFNLTTAIIALLALPHIWKTINQWLKVTS